MTVEEFVVYDIGGIWQLHSATSMQSLLATEMYHCKCMACIPMPIAMITYEVEVASDNVYMDTQCNRGIDMQYQYVAQYRSTLQAQTCCTCTYIWSVCVSVVFVQSSPNTGCRRVLPDFQSHDPICSHP